MTAPALPTAQPPALPAAAYVPPGRWRGWSPTGPLLGKELRQMARRKRTYLLRVVYLGLLLAILGFVWLIHTDFGFNGARSSDLVQQAQKQAELGRYFFATFAFFTIGFMQVIAPVLTSNAIGAERTARTFDVLMMTPVSAWQVVCGKLFSRLATALTLVGLSLPVLAIVRLLGGVEVGDMVGLIGLAAATATASAALGLFFSTFIQRAWGVILLSVFVQGAIYCLLPICIGLLMDDWVNGRARQMMAMRLWGAWWPIIACGFNVFPVGMSIGWWVPAAVQCGLALLLLLVASALIVRRIGRGVAGDVGPRTAPAAASGATSSPWPADAAPFVAMPATSPPPLPYEPTPVPRRGRTVGDNPVLWHAVRQPLMPKLWQRIVATIATLGLLLLTYVVMIEENGLGDRDTHTGYAVVFHSVLLLMATVVSATAMAGEKESDTWTLLIVSPVTGWQVVWGKFCGSLRRLLWPWGIVVGHFGVAAATGVVRPHAALITVVMTLACNLLWIATGLILSLRCRRTTVAVVLNLCLPLLLYGGVPLLLAAGHAVAYSGRYVGYNLAQLSAFYMPYYYEVDSIDQFGRGGSYYDYSGATAGRPIRLPFFQESVSEGWFVTMAMSVALTYVGLTFVLLHSAAARFDRWAGRAR